MNRRSFLSRLAGAAAAVGLVRCLPAPKAPTDPGQPTFLFIRDQIGRLWMARIDDDGALRMDMIEEEVKISPAFREIDRA